MKRSPPQPSLALTIENAGSSRMPRRVVRVPAPAPAATRSGCGETVAHVGRERAQRRVLGVLRAARERETRVVAASAAQEDGAEREARAGVRRREPEGA